MEQFSEPIIYFEPTNGKLKLAPHGFYASAPADAKSNQLKSIQNRINGERQEAVCVTDGATAKKISWFIIKKK